MTGKTVVIIFILIGLASIVKSQVLVDSLAKPLINKKILASAIITESAIYVAGMSYLQFVWYKDKELVPFEFYNDSKGYLQIDKCGHAFASYGESYVAYNWLRRAGMSRNKALLFGGTMGFIMQAPIEIFDGIYEGWGFSWSDIIANTAGCTLLIGQEMLFGEQVARFKISYSRSEISREVNGYLGNNALEGFFYDYNSHSFWLSMNANKLFLKKVLPPWLNIAIGYSADGMLGEFENIRYYQGNKMPQYDRTRQFLLSLDVDWEKIPTHSRFLKTLFYGLNFIKVPFPTLEINSKGKFTPYLVYF
jgi:uncharacterized protein YfiM (DUF2279 family)